MNEAQASFRLPDFLRCAWAGEDAKTVWLPRLDRIRNAWPDICLDIIARRRAECAFRAMAPRMVFRLQAEAKRRGVALAVLGVRGVAVPGHAFQMQANEGKPFLYDVAFGTEPAARAMEALWERGDYMAVYRLAGFPRCCVEALQEDISNNRIDPLCRLAQFTGCVEIQSGALVDPLWRALTIERAGFAPCSLDCADALKQNQRWMEAAVDCGYQAEMDWLKDILSWPLEWSALHGIAELKTPILKLTYTADATNRKILVRYRGEGYPKEGAKGLTFPYRPSAKPPLTSSSGFRRGMEKGFSG